LGAMHSSIMRKVGLGVVSDIRFTKECMPRKVKPTALSRL